MINNIAWTIAGALAIGELCADFDAAAWTGFLGGMWGAFVSLTRQR